MSVHGLPRHICPYCQKRFDTKQGVTAHQKTKRHRTEDKSDGAAERRALRSYDHDRRKQIKQRGS